MWNTNAKLLDQIFELKFTSKQLVKESKRCEAEEKSQKIKIKQAMEKSNMEGAKIYAQNAMRKKAEALNYLKLSSRLDAVVTRLDMMAKNQTMSKSMQGIVKSLGSAMKSNSLEKMVMTMDTFEKQFENLDVQTGVMEDAMNQQVALTVSEDDTNLLMQQVADEYGLDVKVNLPTANASTVPMEPAQKDELGDRLAALRGR